MYEALRAYVLEGHPSQVVARAFGYSPGAFRVLCHHFRRDPSPQFFVSPTPGPRTQPKKSKARDVAVALRKQNRSVYAIVQALKDQAIGLRASSSPVPLTPLTLPHDQVLTNVALTRLETRK
jgi:hypothetical protein